MSATVVQRAGNSSECVVREANAADNRALIALAAACPMRGDLSLRIDRGPDFFALNRLEGERWRVGVVDREELPVGCVAFSERRVYLNGKPTLTGYAGDLKVHPAHRDSRVADALSLFAGAMGAGLPTGTPTLITVLAGNRAMERRLSGPRGLPRFTHIATVRSHAVSILWRRRPLPGSRLVIQRAQWRDLNDMISLWRRVAPVRQFAPVLDASGLCDWIGGAPGLAISSYLLARGGDGKLVGFFALWDQRSFKQMRVESYSPRLAVTRRCFNAIAPLMGAEKLPREGGALRFLTALHVCVPREHPEILRALVIEAHNALRHKGYSFFNVGLDVLDPLTAGMGGLLAQPTDVNAFVTSSRAPVDAAEFAGRPLHYEIALV
ncbi:MAG: hypothetical protein H0T48_16345 [Gemmatimonadaceae bacterium]|nr:hypothetical protein [Gemmatimonadaceae bacterium]